MYANVGKRRPVTRYAVGNKTDLSCYLVAGNLAGNSDWPFSNWLNLLKKSLEFKSSPGHQIFLYIQTSMELSSDNIEAKCNSACVRTIDDSMHAAFLLIASERRCYQLDWIDRRLLTTQRLSPTRCPGRTNYSELCRSVAVYDSRLTRHGY